MMPLGIVFYSPDTAEDGGPEWYVYPPRWEVEVYADIGVDRSHWASDTEQDILAGPFESADEAEAWLAERGQP